MTVCARLASFDAPVGQIVFFRAAVALVPIVGYMIWLGQFPHGLKTKRPMGHVKRNLYGCVATFLSFLSLAYLPLALAAALGFLAPMLVVPLAIIFLGERPGWIVAGATVAGFAGVALMLAPAFEGPSLDSGMVIGVAAGFAMAVTTAASKVQIKSLSETETAGAIAFYFALVCAIAGLLTWPFGWSAASGSTLSYLIGAGVFGGFAHIAMNEALARAPASTLSPFEYTAMIWALAFDVVIFSLLPDVLSLIGAFVIVGAAAVVAFADRIVASLARRRAAIS